MSTWQKSRGSSKNSQKWALLVPQDSVESCVFRNLRSAWSYGDNLCTQCRPFLLSKEGSWPHSQGSGLSSKAFEDHFFHRLNEMQNGSRTKQVLLREHAWVLGGKVIAKLYMYFFFWTFEKINSGFSLIFFFFPKETYMATAPNLFQMDLVTEWLIIHSVVSYVVKLRNLQQTDLELCFTVSGRKDNP